MGVVEETWTINQHILWTGKILYNLGKYSGFDGGEVGGGQVVFDVGLTEAWENQKHKSAPIIITH